MFGFSKKSKKTTPVYALNDRDLEQLFGRIDIVQEHQLDAKEMVRRFREAKPTSGDKLSEVVSKIIDGMIPPVNPLPWSHMKGRTAQ